MEKNKKLYNENSIESLEPLEFTRLKPQVYAGDTTYATQLLIEILSNSIDEHRNGNGNKIIINIDKDVVSVQDNGQGFLVNQKRDDGKTVLEAAFSVMNTSGKYREDGTYDGISLGSFGIGSKLTNFLSNWLEVISTRGDGIAEKVEFEEGVFKNRVIIENFDQPSGTFVKWKASPEFFVHNTVEMEKIKEYLEIQCAINSNLTIELNDNGQKHTYHFPQGLKELVETRVGQKEIINNRLYIDKQEGREGVNLVMTYIDKSDATIEAFVNSGWTEKGPHITQLKTLITREFNKFFREQGWLKEKESNLTGNDIQEGLYIIFNMISPTVKYDAQVKARITQLDMKTINEMITESLAIYMASNIKDMKIIVDRALLERKAREAAKKAKESVKNKKGEKKPKMAKFDSKLADAFGKNRQACELLIVEGDSAAGNMKDGRNNEFQAILGLRGKILNVQTNKIERVKANKEILSFYEALGLDYDINTMKMTYDKDKLRYGKIIIASDADEDGSHIKNLFLNLVWWSCPELIYNGHVYALLPPLYRVTINKDKYLYLRDEKALVEYKKQLAGKIGDVSRLKGLGEMGLDETVETLLDPDKRELVQLKLSREETERVDDLFKIFMGNKTEERKVYVKDNLEKATLEV